MSKPRSFFVVPPLPAGCAFEGCTVATSARPHPHTFVKTRDGTIYVFSAVRCDLLSNYGSNDNARCTFAQLAGIPIRDVRAAVKAARAEDAAEYERVRLARVQREAKALGLRLVKTRKARP
ncbi:MAG TPA: hypothetical protein VF292_03085 [Rhodanobacteraceae bacterium]